MSFSYKKAYLILADGTVFEGKSFGKEGSVIGETVFTTGLVGYQETLTDPSYYGQLVVQTFPTIGNYGVNSIDKESEKIHLSGYIVNEWCTTPSNFRCEEDINEYLIKNNIIGIYDIDTRCLTKKIREFGVINGMITTQYPIDFDEALKQINAFKIECSVEEVSNTKIEVNNVDNAKYNVVLFDFGFKHNIKNELLKRNCNVTVVPYNTTVEELLKLNPDGIMLSNGPGDPSANVEVIDTLKKIIKLNIPIFGICLGHQLMALANGAKTQKLKYGHRGANQPVKDLKTGRVYVTSQNHGYEVVSETVNKDIGEVSHINVNDGSCEGVRYFNAPAFTVQFHPEACAGPLDTMFLFDEFIKNIDTNKKG